MLQLRTSASHSGALSLQFVMNRTSPACSGATHDDKFLGSNEEKVKLGCSRRRSLLVTRE